MYELTENQAECYQIIRNGVNLMNINIEKLNEYLKSEEILEFDSDKECMEYFNTYDYQNLKSVEEMKSSQGKYGFSIGKRRYHINTEVAMESLYK